MSKKHPIIAITGSSGAGTSTTQRAINIIFQRLGIYPALIQGDGFHRFTRAEMLSHYENNSKISHFGPEGNLFFELNELFETYGNSGTGKHRVYLRESDETLGATKPGTFSAWSQVPSGTDLLFYEGLHGAVITDEVNIAQHVDLMIGVAPVVNLEWMQQIYRNTKNRSYAVDNTIELIMRRMPDYIQHIVPQFARTDINFQRIPLIDSSNPFQLQALPRADQTLVVIKEQNPAKTKLDYPKLISMLKGAYLSEQDTLVVPGQHFNIALQFIIEPLITRLMDYKNS